MLKTKVLRLLSILLVIGLIFGTMPTVFAEEDTTTTEENTETTTNDGTSDDSTEDDTVAAGLTPDSILYVLDRLLENIQITLTIDEAKKTLLLMTISEERLAEAEYLIDLAQNEEVNEEEWNQLLQDVVDDYREKVDKALEVTEELAYETDDDSKADLDEIVEKISSAVDFDSEALKNNDQINEVKDSALLVANVVSDLDKEIVAEIRNLGVGYGQISQIFALSEASEKDIDEIAALFTEEKMGLGQATKELGIKTSDFAKIKNSTAVEENDDEDENYNDNNENNDENENAVELNYANNNNGEESEIQANNKVKADKGDEVGNKDNNGNDNPNANEDNSNSNKDKIKDNKSSDKNNNSKANDNSNN